VKTVLQTMRLRQSTLIKL